MSNVNKLIKTDNSLENETKDTKENVDHNINSLTQNNLVIESNNNENEKAVETKEEKTANDNQEAYQKDVSKKATPNLNLNNISQSVLLNCLNWTLLKNKDINSENKNEIESFSKYKFNYTNVTLNPIENFYEFINKTINDVIMNYFSTFAKENLKEIEEAKKLTDNITLDNQSILNKKKELKYVSNMWRYWTIFVCFFLIIGVFFIKPFKNAKQKINEFRAFQNAKNADIENYKNQRFYLVKLLFSTLSLKQIIYSCFEQYGIIAHELIPATTILKALRNNCFIDVLCGIGGFYKSNPFYDVVVRSLIWRDIVTSRSQSFYYTTTETYMDSEGHLRTRVVTRTETLTAYHHEMTPFIENQNMLIYATNFEPSFSFSTNNAKLNKDLVLENPEFSKNYKIELYTSKDNLMFNKQCLNQFFTIKAQEDYLTWYHKNNGKVEKLVKLKGMMLVENNSFDFSNLYLLNQNFLNTDFLFDGKEYSLDYYINKIKNSVTNYFRKISNLLTLPLLSPVINREWYQLGKKEYLISENYADFLDNKTSIEIDPLYAIYRFFGDKIVWFLTNIPKKNPWFSLFQVNKLAKDVIEYNYQLNSFYSKILTDFVKVTGQHVGTKIIPVPYERFYFFSEPKTLLQLLFNNSLNIKIIVNNSCKTLIFKDDFKDANFAQECVNLGIWTDQIEVLEKLEYRDKLIQKFKQFKQLNVNNQLSLIIDNIGVYLILNSPFENKSELIQLLDGIKQLMKV
ncbi:MAG: hypothetical protein HUJ42_03375 [Malacoplasma sp.]|nr:hypothetical protein [Malacoplasma sp.]